MTEKEAKRKWCPFVRVFETKDGDQWSNRPDAGFASDAYCMGSGCMAWRWSVVTNKHGDRVRSDETDTPVGYCGLASKP